MRPATGSERIRRHYRRLFDHEPIVPRCAITASLSRQERKREREGGRDPGAGLVLINLINASGRE